MTRHRCEPLRLVTPFLFSFAAAAAAAVEPAPRPVTAAELGPVRVAVVVEQVDTATVDSFLGRRYRKEFDAVIAERADLDKVANDDATERMVETSAIMFFVSMGGGLIGGMQQAAREDAAVEVASTAVRSRIPALREQHALDRAFADGLAAELAAAGLKVDGAIELVAHTKGSELDERKDAMVWFTEHHGTDERPMLLVSLRHGLSRSLTGDFGIATAWLLAPRGTTLAQGKGVAPGKAAVPDAVRSDYLTHFADGTRRKQPLVDDGKTASSAERMKRSESIGGRQLISAHRALFVTPVPVQDLSRPPQRIVDQRIAAIHADYDDAIETQSDRDLRRYLKTRRKSELESAPRWTPSQLTEHLRDAWMAPPGDVYPRLVGAAERDLAKRVAAGLLPAP